MENSAKLGQPRPIISYWASGDPTAKIPIVQSKLTEINIIKSKRITDDFINFCVHNKHRIFLHLEISGMGQTAFELYIPTVKTTFYMLKKLIDSGFPHNQVLVIVNPIIPNDNGLNALKLLMRVFSEFKDLKLRYVRFTTLSYKQWSNGQYQIANPNITKRLELKPIEGFVKYSQSFWKEYYALIESYKAIITVDNNTEYLIGVRELLPFGYKNEWFEDVEIIGSDGKRVISSKRTKLISYEKNSKTKPIVNIISNKNPIRCLNRCVLCPHQC